MILKSRYSFSECHIFVHFCHFLPIFMSFFCDIFAILRLISLFSPTLTYKPTAKPFLILIISHHLPQLSPPHPIPLYTANTKSC